MIFRQLIDAESSTLTYLIADDSTREAILIDRVFEQYLRDLALLRELELQLVYFLCDLSELRVRRELLRRRRQRRRKL